MEQELRRHALEQAGGSGLVVDMVRQRNHQAGIHGPDGRVGAERRASVGDAPAWRQMTDIGADIDDDAGRFQARHARWLEQIEIAGPAIDIDIVDADRSLPQANLARSRRRRLGRLRAEFLRAAVAVDDDGGAGDGGARTLPDRGRSRCGFPCPPLSAGPALHPFPDRRKTCFVDLGRNQRRKFPFLPRRGAESGRPAPEGPVAVGDRFQLDLGDIVVQRDIRADDGIAEAAVPVGQGEQALADVGAVLQVEVAHAADLVGALRLLEEAAPDNWVPAVVAIEIAQDFPHRRDGRVDHRAADHPDHGVRPRSGP